MNLKDFILKIDVSNSIVLLEGKRIVRDENTRKLYDLGRLLDLKTDEITLRSGNADDSDLPYSSGLTAIHAKKFQVITPYSGHLQKTNQAFETISLEEINIASEPEVVYQSKG